MGSAVVMWADRQPVTWKQVEVLYHYCQFKLQPVSEDSIGAGIVERTQEEVGRDF